MNVFVHTLPRHIAALCRADKGGSANFVSAASWITQREQERESKTMCHYVTMTEPLLTSSPSDGCTSVPLTSSHSLLQCQYRHYL